MQVYVIMGGDFPLEIWSNYLLAEERVGELKAEDAKQRPGQRRIHYRSEAFEVQGGEY